MAGSIGKQPKTAKVNKSLAGPHPGFKSVKRLAGPHPGYRKGKGALQNGNQT